MHRVYSPHVNFNSQEVTLTDPKEIHHLRDVLRLKKGAEVCLFDGKNQEAMGKIELIAPNEVRVKILEIKKQMLNERKIILACAIPKKSKFEFIIEKVTELGVDEIIPLKTRRTEINLNKERLVKKNLRYQTVAINAAKQCRRSNIPLIHPITDFTNALTQLSQTTTVLIASLMEPRIPLIQALQQINSSKNISIFIGPEGDFTPEEYHLAQNSHCIAVSLGATILKVDTAAMSTVAMINLLNCKIFPNQE